MSGVRFQFAPQLLRHAEAHEPVRVALWDAPDLLKHLLLGPISGRPVAAGRC